MEKPDTGRLPRGEGEERPKTPVSNRSVPPPSNGAGISGPTGEARGAMIEIGVDLDSPLPLLKSIKNISRDELEKMKIPPSLWPFMGDLLAKMSEDDFKVSLAKLVSADQKRFFDWLDSLSIMGKSVKVLNRTIDGNRTRLLEIKGKTGSVRIMTIYQFLQYLKTTL